MKSESSKYGEHSLQGLSHSLNLCFYRNIIAPLVLGVDGAVYLPHPSYAAVCAHYANAMASNQVEIILTNNEDDT